MLPLGLTIFDYVRDGDRVQMSLPLEGDTSAKSDDPLFADVDLAETFLRGPFAFPGSCTASGDVDVQCRAEDGTLLRSFAIDPHSATIAEETSWTADGAARLVLRYSDFALLEGVVLPRHISLAYPQRGIALDIDVERYEVNPVLAADLFRPPSP